VCHTLSNSSQNSGGARCGLFGSLQHALRSRKQGCTALRKGVHAALDDFQWLHCNLDACPTRLCELVQLQPLLAGAHDAAGAGTGGVWFPAPHALPHRTPVGALVNGHIHQTCLHKPIPIVWCCSFPQHVQHNLVSWSNPHGTVTNSDSELAGSLLHQDVGAQCHDTCKRTTLSQTDNTPTMFWQHKGSTTTAGPPAYLLCNQAMHQHFHCCVSLNDHLEGKCNGLSDDASCLGHLSNTEFLTHFNSNYPQSNSWHLCQPTPKLASVLTSSLLRMRSEPVSLLVEPNLPMHTGTSGPSFVNPWPLILSSKTLATPSASSKSLPSDTALEPWLPKSNAFHHEQ